MPPPPPPPPTESASNTQDDGTVAGLDVSATASDIANLGPQMTRASAENQQIAMQRNERERRMEIADRTSRHEMTLSEERNRSDIGISERRAAAEVERIMLEAESESRKIEAEAKRIEVESLAEAKRIEAETERIRSETVIAEEKSRAEIEKSRVETAIAERKSIIEAEKDRLGIPAIPQRHTMATIRMKLDLARDLGCPESTMDMLRLELSNFLSGCVGGVVATLAPPQQQSVQPPQQQMVQDPPPPPPPPQQHVVQPPQPAIVDNAILAPQVNRRQMRLSDFMVPQCDIAVQPQARPATFSLEMWLSLNGKPALSHGRLTVFGKRVSRAYRATHDGTSPMRHGRWNAYSDADSGMIEEIYRGIIPHA
jgi:hypothetical protein